MKTLDTLRLMEAAASEDRTDPARALGAWRSQALASAMRNVLNGPPDEVVTLRLRPFLSRQALSARGHWAPGVSALPAWRGLMPSPLRGPGAQVPWIQGWLFLGPEMAGVLRRGSVPHQIAGRERHPFPLEPLLFAEPITEEGILNWLSTSWRERWWQDLPNPFLVGREGDPLPEAESPGGVLWEGRPALFQDTTEDGTLAEPSEAPPQGPARFFLGEDSSSSSSDQ